MAASPLQQTGFIPGSPVRGRRKRRTAVKRIVLSAFALAWIVGCVLVLTHVFSAVRLKCAGCPECLGTAP